MYLLSCHPTRPFIAVGTSDGLIDVWGPRLDWVAFAPDFQALQHNVVYEEKEDEFDVVVDENCDKEGAGSGKGKLGIDEKVGRAYVHCGRYSSEDEDVDIMTVDTGIPAFNSDSDDGSEVFYFNTKVDKILSTEKQASPKKVDHEH